MTLETSARESWMLIVDRLHVHFASRASSFFSRAPTTHAVQGVSLTLSAGESLGIVGESGSGKSTLGRAIVRLVHAQSGQVIFNNVDVLRARGSVLQSLRKNIQIIFQDPAGSLDPHMRVVDIVTEPLAIHRLLHSRAERWRAAEELLERCGLPSSAARRYPHEFSGGQRQRIGIARALALKPRLIVCDEPTSALDVSVQAQIVNLFADLRRDLGLSYLFISHDLAVVQHLCPRIAVMRNGSIVEQGPREQILNSPREDYTRTLIASVPVADPRRGRLEMNHAARVTPSILS